MKSQGGLPNSAKIIIFGLILRKKRNENLEYIYNHSLVRHTSRSCCILLPLGGYRGRASAHHLDNDYGIGDMSQEGADHRTDCSQYHRG
jgi:hypothetical protein